jgi:hypothetical protein
MAIKLTYLFQVILWYASGTALFVTFAPIEGCSPINHVTFGLNAFTLGLLGAIIGFQRKAFVTIRGLRESQYGDELNANLG